MKKASLRQLTSGACVWALIAGGMMAAPALAQTSTATETVQAYNLPAQDLNRALLQFAQSAGLQLFYDNNLVDGRRSGALKGNYTPRQALTKLLAGTGLDYTISGNTVRLTTAQATGDSGSLGTIRVQGDGVAGDGTKAGAPLAYEMGDPIDSGTSILSRESIEARQTGNGDVNQTLKILPHVYFSTNEGRATSDDIQDLRPSEVSIAGSQPYENSFILDGVAANSRLDVMSSDSSNPAHYDKTSGASAETLWVDSSLVDAVTVRDSNVSARYGGFTGGVVEIDTRAPRKDYGATIYRSCTSDALVSFKIDPQTREALGSNVPNEPDYTKCRTGMSVDLPVSDYLRLMVGASRQEAELTYYKNANYGNAPFGLKSESRNLLLKAEADLPKGMTLTTQYSYTPYTQEYSRENMLNDLIVTQGGGKSGRIELKGRAGSANWKLTATHAASNSSRSSPGNLFTWPVTVLGSGYCSSTNCVFGGFGDIAQTQKDTNLKGQWSQPLWGGSFDGGFDFGYVAALKQRFEDNASYNTATGTSVGALVVCSDGDPACMTGKGVLTTKLLYPAYDITVDVRTRAAWAEYSRRFGDLNLRAGLRYDSESVLDNDNFAPRVSVSYDFPWVTATFGANRYYHQSFLGYAIQGATARTFTYRRTVSKVGSTYKAGDWYLYSVSSGTIYDGIALKTPYSDELTLAFSRSLWGGQGRLKLISRDYEDQLTRSTTTEARPYTKADGTTGTYNVYLPTNGGESTYRGVSLEWGKNFGRHTVTFSGNWGETKTNIDATNAYMAVSDTEEVDGDLVYYQGQVRTLMDVLAENQRLDFAAPGLANLDWSARWLNGRLRTNLNARWRDAFDQLEDTGSNITVGGASYDVYDIVHYGDTIAFNGGFDAELVRRGRNVVTLEVKGTNLLDTLPKITGTTSTSQPYRFGRSFWVGIKYKY
ncbi:TonB-dependent receptor [Asticcacaulis sp.]|uniref:TonB-dependent receptor n=1 Tax=Asticcacaulis sp. TaxID=1872648 RepID=UPI0026040F52|nr:TonB-dependent receptor [Asticcacaulis sp.]